MTAGIKTSKGLNTKITMRRGLNEEEKEGATLLYITQ